MPKLYDMYSADTVEVVARAISAALSEAVLLVASTGELIWHNPVALSLFQISSDELLARRLDDERWRAIALDGSPFDFGAAAAAADSGQQDAIDAPLGIRTGDSRLKWLKVDLIPIEIDGDSCRIVVLSDVTKRIAEQRALQRTKESLRAGLAPAELPASDVVRFAAGRRNGRGTDVVAADFYGVSVDDEAARFVLGDSFGAGVSAVGLSTAALTSLRAISGMVDGPAAAVERLDTVMDSGPRQGVTAVCGRIERSEEITTMSMVCAGHALPILVRGGHAIEIGATSPMIGVAARSGRTATTHGLRSGDVVIMYTDGLMKAAEPRLSNEDLLARIPTNVPVESVVDTLLRMFDVSPGAEDGLAVFGLEVR